MFAYCNNNPVNYSDSSGCVPGYVIFPVCLDPEGNHYEPTLGEYINRIAKPVETTFDALLAHTHSTGIVLSGNLWNMTMGKSFNLSNDNSGDFAWQESTTMGAATSVGVGGSVGVSHTITNAQDVQDLTGLSYCYGATFCCGKGISIDIIRFETSAGDTKWGICVAWVTGVEFEVHAYESFTTSTDSRRFGKLFN